MILTTNVHLLLYMCKALSEKLLSDLGFFLFSFRIFLPLFIEKHLPLLMLRHIMSLTIITK